MQDPDAKQRSLNKYNKVFWINLKKIALHLLIKNQRTVCVAPLFSANFQNRMEECRNIGTGIFLHTLHRFVC